MKAKNLKIPDMNFTRQDCKISLDYFGLHNLVFLFYEIHLGKLFEKT